MLKAPFIATPADAVQKVRDYRPDIDGLRAIAVLSVVFFHAFPSLFHGGFVGVDIFFVISGFLISKHIWEELGAGTFSIKTFYARRVIRIFPALIVVLLACLILGWIILTPSEYERLGNHIIAGAAFVSNIIFWREAGYFDSAADTKPLLHLWSLGIEEQFYIVWPLFLAFFWRYSKHLGWAFIGVLCTSFLYSVFLVRHNSVADFYSPLTRFWELALGAALSHAAIPKSATHRSIISWLGLLLILAAVTMVQSSYSFPGAWALLPTIGAACLIYAGEDAWLNRHVLSRRLLVWIGLISYPLYLWHWPLLSFTRIIESNTPSFEVRFWLVTASVVLAWLTYSYLELPVRARRGGRYIVLMLCLSIFLLGAAGLTVKKQSGFKFRTFSMLNGDTTTIVLGADRDKLQHECGISEAEKSLFQYCLRGSDDPHYAILGDSKAEALFYGLVRESKADQQWMMIGSVYPPGSSYLFDDRQQHKNQLALQTIVQNPAIKVVVLAVALRDIFPVNHVTGYLATDFVPSPAKVISYSSTIQQLEQSGKSVVFFIDNPTFPDPTSCISGGATSSPFLNQFLSRKRNPYCTIRYTDFLAGTQAYRQFANEMKQLHPRLTIYDPTPLLCDIPHNLCTVTLGGKFLYSYGDHISDYANSMIAKDMLPVIRTLVP